MRKMVLFCLFTAVICGNIFAQSNNQITTIKGTLKISGNRFSVVSGNITYSVRGLERLVGVVDGLKDGAQVSMDGYAMATAGQNERVFNPLRITINGKSYEVGSPGAGNPAAGRDGNGPSPSGRGR